MAYTVRNMKKRLLVFGLVVVALPTLTHAQVPRAASGFSATPSLKDYLNIEFGVELFGLGVSRSAWRAGNLDPNITLRVIASTWGGYLVESVAEKRLGNSEWSGAVFARASTLERNRFYGFGNSTDASRQSRFYQLEQLRLEAGAALTFPLPGEGNRVTFGPVFQHLWTENDAADGQSDDNPNEVDDDGVIQLLGPYGGGSFQQFGFQTTVGLGTPGPRSGAATGLRFDVEARVFPAWLDLTSPTAITSADLRAFAVVPAPLGPAVFVRVSVDRVFGNAPFHETAFLGGRRSLRGFQKQRFAGDLLLAVNSELRLDAWRFQVAGRYVQGGPAAIFDVGRVYVDGVSSGGWHVGAGAGFWLREDRSGRMVSVALAKSAEGVRSYIAVGFPFWH